MRRAASRNIKRLLATDGHGLPIRALNICAGTLAEHLATRTSSHNITIQAFITAGTLAEGTPTLGLIGSFRAKLRLTDRGYDRDALLKPARLQGVQLIIPPGKNRKKTRQYDVSLYTLRHRVENAPLHRKRRRATATCHAKNTASFLAAAYIRCIDV